MNYFYIILVLCPALVFAEQVKVSLYYESLCPYCVTFIKHQLYPAQQKIGQYLVLDLVPFGNATVKSVDGKTTFECQNGPNECTENMIQGCVLAGNYTQEEKIKFVACYVGADVDAGKKCAEESNVRPEDLDVCMNDTLGTTTMVNNGKKSSALQPAFMSVPHVVFNDKFDAELKKRALVDFMGTVCGLLEGAPAECK